ncbi:MAG: cytochrome C oxidase subunit IV family protein [Candidatus Rokubacteria bacterium]|nr:cytochrome C oxidase subunit IV family protein [Candidatus Rokubacteria bacterium]
MTSGKVHPNYTAVWLWLLALLGLGVAASFLPGGRTLAVLVILATASAKALLVALNFMHLRFEPALLYALVLIPLLFLVVLAAVLFPDFVWHSRPR